MSIREKLVWLEGVQLAAPSEEIIPEVLALIETGSPFDSFFYHNSKCHPGWLAILWEKGYFHKLEEGNGEGVDGHARPFPVLTLLEQLVEEYPQEVCDILCSLQIPDNRALADQILRCVRRMRNPEFIGALTPIAKSAFKVRGPGVWLWAEDIFKNWLEMGGSKEVLSMLPTYFSSVLAEGNPEVPIEDASQVVEVDRSIVVKLMKEFPMEVARYCFEALNLWASRERKRRKHDPPLAIDKYLDEEINEEICYPFTYWLPSFESPSTGYHHQLEATLSRRLFESCAKVFKKGDQDSIDRINQLLRSKPWHLFERLRWHLYGMFPDASLDWARAEVIPVLDRFGETEKAHSLEFAILLNGNAEHHGAAFLAPNEVTRFFEGVMNGPITRGKDDNPPDDWSRRFKLKQLWPIADLIGGSELNSYEGLDPENYELKLDDYKDGFSLGGGAARPIEEISPHSMEEFGQMSSGEILKSIQSWVPKSGHLESVDDFYKRESHEARAGEFAKVLESDPDKMSDLDGWCDQVTVPNYLAVPLKRAVARLTQKDGGIEVEVPETLPGQKDWENWFAMARSIVARDPIKETEACKKAESGPHDWTWARRETVSFLGAVSVVRDQVPDDLENQIEILLCEIARGRDLVLEKRNNNPLEEWYSIAINSTRGEAFGKLLNLEHDRKKKGGESELRLYDFFREELNRKDQSPAVFAVFGANLRLAVFLYEKRLKDEPGLLLNPKMPDCCSAFVLSHFLYDNSWAKVIDTFPNLPHVALDTLAGLENRATPVNSRVDSDFGIRVGTHLAFYHWNQIFEPDEKGVGIVDRFFRLAAPDTRAGTVNAIGSIFRKSEDREDEFSDLYVRVMKIWERRFKQITESHSKNTETSGQDLELSEFLSWIRCECFPFEWRTRNVLAALDYLDELPRVWSEVEALNEYSGDPDRLDASILIFKAFSDRYCDNFRWSLHPVEVCQLLGRGLGSTNQLTREAAIAAQENLLQQELFEYRKIEAIS